MNYTTINDELITILFCICFIVLILFIVFECIETIRKGEKEKEFSKMRFIDEVTGKTIDYYIAIRSDKPEQ